MRSFEGKPFLNEVPGIEPVPVIANNIVNEAINNFEKQRDETVLDWGREIDENNRIETSLICLHCAKDIDSLHKNLEYVLTATILL